MSEASLVKRLIAKHDGVSPEAVTIEYIIERRAARKHQLPLILESKYGGYHVQHLRILTEEEIEAGRRAMDAFLAEGTP